MRFTALALLTTAIHALTPNHKLRVARKNTLDSSVTFDEYQNIMARSRRPIVRDLHAVDATRVHLTMTGVVSFSISRPFGPFPVNTMLHTGSRACPWASPSTTASDRRRAPLR